jgi:hypothetical protein
MISSCYILKDELSKIKANQYKVPVNLNAFDLAVDMMEHIGDVDSELRDNLIYSTILNWVTQDVFNTQQMRELLNISLDDQHLFWKIGEIGTDSVFTRSFSMLMIPLVLDMDRKYPFLAQEEVRMIKNKLLNYIMLEKDRRGYVENKGWAHAIAHTADALEDLSQSIHMDETCLIEILHAIHETIAVNDYLYINGEDERMVTATVSIFKRNVLEDMDINGWIHSFSKAGKLGKHPEDDFLHKNIKCFLRSLYFRLVEDNQLRRFTDTIVATIRSIDAE